MKFYEIPFSFRILLFEVSPFIKFNSLDKSFQSLVKINDQHYSIKNLKTENPVLYKRK